MFLQKLDIQGFKSFAHKTTFIFPRRTREDRGITAVVGPNGSGKSNVADAIRWVLGEQSMKILRSKKSEDVIFFGSDTKAQLGFCEVSLHFNNEDHALPLEYAEVVIARRLYRNGDSEYLINGGKVRLTDIVLLLAQAQCGQRSYSVIGQGMIDSIVTMSPMERKYFFDEAAGVRHYQIKKDQAQHKLKATKDNIRQAQIVIAELEPKLKFFQRQFKRLEERGMIEKELDTKLKAYYGHAWALLHQQRGEHRASMKEMEHMLDAKRIEHAARETEFHSHERKQSAGTLGAADTSRRDHEELSEKRSAVLARISLLDARLATEYERKGEANLSFVLQRRGELESQLRTEHGELESAMRERTECQKTLHVQEEELKKTEYAIAETEQALVPSADASQSLSIESIHTALRLLREEKAFFFSGERTQEQLLEGLARLFGRLDELVQATTLSNTPSSHILERKHALEGLYQKKRTSLSAIQDIRVALALAMHAIEQHEKSIKNISAEQDRLVQEIAYFTSEGSKEKKSGLIEERDTLSHEKEALDERLAVLKKDIDAAYAIQANIANNLLRIQNALVASQKIIDDIRSRHTAYSLDLAKCEAHQDELLAKMCEELSLDAHAQEAVRAHDFDVSLVGIDCTVAQNSAASEARRSADQLKRKLDAIGEIDQEALSEYESTKERYEFLTTQSADLSAGIETLERGITELEQTIKERFQSSLSIIEKKFDQYFQQLFNGGRAAMVLVKASEDRLEERVDGEESDSDSIAERPIDEIAGIDISAMPPGKKLRNMSVLSGGEKALTAIALICAIVSHNPSPFVVLDEVDAALDESNANRFASIIQELGEKTQFIVITHNRATIHTAQCMYGVTMGEDGISRVLSLDIGNIDDTLNNITKS